MIREPREWKTLRKLSVLGKQIIGPRPLGGRGAGCASDRGSISCEVISCVYNFIKTKVKEGRKDIFSKDSCDRRNENIVSQCNGTVYKI